MRYDPPRGAVPPAQFNRCFDKGPLRPVGPGRIGLGLFCQIKDGFGIAFLISNCQKAAQGNGTGARI